MSKNTNSKNAKGQPLVTPHKGRPSASDLITIALGKKDFMPDVVTICEDAKVTTILGACAAILAATKYDIKPNPLRSMVRLAKNARRVRKDSALWRVCHLKRGPQGPTGPRKPKTAVEPEPVAAS